MNDLVTFTLIKTIIVIVITGGEDLLIVLDIVTQWAIYKDNTQGYIVTDSACFFKLNFSLKVFVT